MRILLLGNTGQLGWELERTLATAGEVHAYDFPGLDLTKEAETRALIRSAAPFDMIVNATAYTAVDKAESEPDLVRAINATGPEIMADEAQVQGAAFVHFSTDFVFDGKQKQPYIETDTPRPLGVYGKTKLAGELAIERIGGAYLILRTSWVYSLRRESFVTKVLKWSRQQETLKMVTDQVRSPTWARLLAEATAQVLAMAGAQTRPWLAERKGLYHLAGSGQASMFEWAQEILTADPRRQEQVVRQLLPARTDEFPTPAQRPLFSVLDCRKFTETFGISLPPWQAALRLALDAG
jgi:dTDP-4-dehydrorhamnose reductase